MTKVEKNGIKPFIYQQIWAALDRINIKLTRKKPQMVAQLTTLDHPLDAIYQHENVVFEIPIEHVYYPYQYGYAIDAWHPFVKTLLEYTVNPDLAYEDSILHAYYQKYQPDTIRDVLLFGETSEVGRELDAFRVRHFFSILPWEPAFIIYDREELALGTDHGHQGFGPVSKLKGALEFKRLVDTFKSIQTRGYQPNLNNDGEINGYFLRHENDYRFIIRSGLHRTAALSALGYPLIRVKCFPAFPRFVHTAFVKEWPLVKQDKIKVETAIAITERFFTDNGKDKANLIGLLT